MKAFTPAVLVPLILLSGCGPTAEEQHVLDQQRCGGFGFAPGSDAFAHCMMSVSQQREAQDAADRRAAADRDAANKRTQDAWDKRTGQGAYSSGSTSSSSSSSPFSSSNPVDQIRNSIDQDMRKIEGSQ